MNSSNRGPSRPKGVSRIFYKEIKEGDRRKFEGRSNDAQTGGGARDVRVNYKKFAPFIKEMLPNVVPTNRTTTHDDGSKSTIQIAVYRGPASWTGGDGKTKHGQLEFWPPTNARPTEGRFARVNDIAALQTLPPISEGRLFLLITQNDDGRVHVRYASWDNIKAGNRAIADHINRCISATPDNRSVAGYLDFATGNHYCHA